MEQPQGHEIPIPTSSAAPTDHDLYHNEDHPDFSPNSDIQLSSDQAQSSAHSEELRRKIIKQVEYYFSDENLPTDNFMLNYVTTNVEGFGTSRKKLFIGRPSAGIFPIGVIASFSKMKKLTRDKSLIVAALKESSFLVVSSNGKKVKRLHPLPLAEVKDPMVCTVLVENLPEDHSVENLRRVFGEAGNIKNITIRDPHDARDPKRCTVAEKLIIGKLHALVEYDTVEAAEKAVSTLNNEQDWRYGLRVKLLKKVKKPGQQKKNVPRESEPERGSTVQTSEQAANEVKHTSEQHDGSHDDEDVDHISKEKNDVHLLKDKSGHKGRNRGRGRKQKYNSTNGHGQGTQFLGHGIEPSKPPPGPRMPDGTRGFTLGRGRTLATS
ncbi:hypothetical protein OROMI_022116 [Orobanche minor]